MKLSSAWLALALVVAPNVHANDGETWLDRVSTRSVGFVYNATVVFASGPELAVVRVSQSLQEGKLQQTFVTLTGKPQTLITAQGMVQREQGGGPPEYLESPLAIGSLQKLDLDAIRRNYAVIMGSSDRVAGRPVRQVQFQPNDAFRFARRAWIDNETGLPLRSAVVTSDQVLEQMVFADLQLSGTAAAPFTEPRTPPDAAVWPGTTAPGYELKAMVGGAAHRHWVFSDGLSAISVFAEQQESVADEERWQRGATLGITRSHGGMRWTVLGEAPLLALEAFLPNADASTAGTP